MPRVQPASGHAQVLLELARELFANVAHRVLARNLVQKRARHTAQMRERRNAPRRARRRLHVRNTDAPQLLQALVHCGAVTLGKHIIDSTLGTAYKQMPMSKEFLVELKRIADALERIAHKEVMLDVSDSISSKSAKHADVGAASTENTHVFDIDIPY